MVRLFVPFELGGVQVYDSVQPFAELVINQFKSNSVLPRIAAATKEVPTFAGLNDEQTKRLTTAFTTRSFFSRRDSFWLMVSRSMTCISFLSDRFL